MPQNIPIKFRRDTTTNWNTIDPIPNEGEPVYNKETGSFKIGNGTAKWSELFDYKNGKLGEHIITVAKTGHGDFVCSDAAYTSDDQCIQAALDHISTLGGGEIKLMSGHYICSQRLNYSTGDTIISGQGGQTILDFTTLPSGTFDMISISGTVTTTNSLLSANATAGSLTITVVDGTNFVAGDWIRIRSEDRYIEWDNAGVNVWQTVGEIQQIASVAGNVITLKEFLHGSYLTTDTATVDLLTMLENITIRDIVIKGPANVSHRGLYVGNAANITVENMLIDDAYHTAIYLYNVVGANVDKNTVHRSTEAGRGYGLMVANCSRDVTGMSNHFFDCRHGITCGGDYHYGVQYNQTYIANTMSYDKHVVGMFGPHPTYDGLTIVGNVCSGCPLGFVNGPNTTVVSNISKSYTIGCLLLANECSNVIVSDNTFIVVTAGEGVQLNSKNSHFDIHDNIIIVPENRDGISVANSPSRVQIHHNNITSAGGGIRFATTDGSSNSDNIKICDNTITVSGSDPGIYVNSDGWNISNVKISGNTINSVVYGIRVHCDTNNISNVKISDNEIISATDGRCIYTDESPGAGVYSHISVTNNTCNGGDYPIVIHAASVCNVDKNEVYDAENVGLYIYSGCTGYKIIGNKFINCVDSIHDSGGDIGRIIMDNIGYNPVGNRTAPTLPASTVAYTNTYGYPCQVQISGGTVTEITLDDVATGMTTFFGIIPPGGTIAITYSSAPAWKWWGL